MRVRAPLIPEVAFVELPPKKSVFVVSVDIQARILTLLLTVLVEHQDIATVEVDGVGSAEAGKTATDDNDTRRSHDELVIWYVWYRKRSLLMERRDGRSRTSGLYEK